MIYAPQKKMRVRNASPVRKNIPDEQNEQTRHGKQRNFRMMYPNGRKKKSEVFSCKDRDIIILTPRSEVKWGDPGVMGRSVGRRGQHERSSRAAAARPPRTAGGKGF